LAREVAGLKAAAACPEAMPVERLLAGRAVACRLRLAQVDDALAGAVADGPAAGRRDLLRRRQGRARRAYRSAIGALAAFRELPGPGAEVAAAAAAAPRGLRVAGPAAGLELARPVRRASGP